MQKKVIILIFLFMSFLAIGDYAQSFAASNDHSNSRNLKKGKINLIWNQNCEKAGGQCVVKEFYEREKENLEVQTGIDCKGEVSKDGVKILQDESNRFVCVKSKTDKKLCNRCSNSEGCTRTSFYIGNTINKDGSVGDALSSTSCDDKADPTIESGKVNKESVADMTCPRILKEDGKTDADPKNTSVNKRCTGKPATETGCQLGEACVKSVNENTQTKTGMSCFLTEGTSKVTGSCVKTKIGNNNPNNNSNTCQAKNGMCLDSCNANYPNHMATVSCPAANQYCCTKTTNQTQQGTNTQCRCQLATVACQGKNMGRDTCGANMINCCTTTSNDPMSQLAQSLGNLLNKILNPSSTSRSGTSSFVTPTITSTPTPSSSSLNNANGVDVTFNLKINFHGITRLNGSSSNLKVKVTLVDSQATTTTKTAVQEGNFVSAGAGVFTGSVTFAKVVPKSGYYLLVKGPKHVQRKICSVFPSENYPGEYTCNGLLTVYSGANDIDASQIYMLAGDVPKQDGIVNSADFGNVKTRFGKSDYASLEVADLNLDGVVNSQDFSLVIQTLQTTGGVDQQ